MLLVIFVLLDQSREAAIGSHPLRSPTLHHQLFHNLYSSATILTDFSRPGAEERKNHPWKIYRETLIMVCVFGRQPLLEEYSRRDGSAEMPRPERGHTEAQTGEGCPGYTNSCGMQWRWAAGAACSKLKC